MAINFAHISHSELNTVSVSFTIRTISFQSGEISLIQLLKAFHVIILRITEVSTETRTTVFGENPFCGDVTSIK